MIDASDITLVAMLLACTEFTAEFARGRTPSKPRRAMPTPPRGWLAGLVVVAAVALATRAWSIWSLEFGTEFTALSRAIHAPAPPGSHDIAALFHAPLHQRLCHAWLALLDRVDAPPLRHWIRLTNVPLSATLALLLGRIGRRLGVPWAGLGAGLLYTASPLFLQLHSAQENYLIETLAGLCFVERLAAYTVQSEPVYRGLGLAAALALWSGYMNLPWLGVGAIALALLARRRRDLHGAVLTLGWTTALVSPLLDRLWTALLALRELAQAGDGGGAVVQHWLHEAMPMSQAYGGGNPGTLAALVLAASFGYAAPLALAALQSLVRSPEARVPAAVVGTFVVAGVCAPLHLQNFGPAALTLQFMACWGIARAADLRFGGGAISLLAMVLGVGVMVLGGLWCWPLFRENSGFLPYNELGALRARLREAPADEPVMIYAQRIPDPQLAVLCQRAASVRGLVSCVNDARSDLREEAWTHRRVVGRPVAIPTANLTSPAIPRDLAPDARLFLSTQPWNRGFLVYRRLDRSEDGAEVAALDALLAPQYREVGRMQRAQLLRCGGLPEAAR